MKYILLLILALVSGCAEGYPIRDVALRLEFAGGGICSGTAVSDDVILTAAHCFINGRLTTINGKPAHALKLVDDGQDHVLVRVSRRFHRWTVIGPEPVQGQHVRMYGQPAGIEFAYRELYVSFVTDHEVMLDGGHTYGGDSGAGLMDAQGRLVGVISGVKWLRSKEGIVFSLVWTNRLRFSAKQLRDMR